MVSELAGEGAMPPQLPTPARRLLKIAELRDRFQQQIRSGSKLRRGVIKRKVFRYFNPSVGAFQSVIHHRRFRFFPSIASSSLWNRSARCSSKVLVNRTSWSKSVKRSSVVLVNSLSVCVGRSPAIPIQFLSKMLISPLFTAFNRSRSENSSSKVLDYPPSVAFNRDPWSRSMDVVGESMSTILINCRSRSRSVEIDDNGEEVKAVNKVRRRRRFVFSDEKADSKAFSNDDESSAVVSRSQFVNSDFVVSTQPSNACFNSNCEEASEWPRKGWRRLTGEFADLCDCCVSAYKEGKLCETFHLNVSGVSDIYKIVKTITEWKFQPVIIFSFSRREGEQHAMSMSKFDFNTEEEKDDVDQVFWNVVLCLNEEDRSPPAIELMLPLLQRGIAVHHSGLLPIIKELVELMFQEGLVKALFVTETFAIGLNMPANLFEEFVDKLNDMVVLLPLSKTGKPKTKEGDGVNDKRGSEDYMVSGVEWNYKKLCSVITVEFHDCSKQVLEMESQIPSPDCFREDFVVLLRSVQTQEKQKLNLTDIIRGDMRSPSPSKALIASKSSYHSKIKKNESLMARCLLTRQLEECKQGEGRGLTLGVPYLIACNRM
nr:hypothetical protein POPTR_018G146001 [Ipomoea trifida]